MGSHGEQRHRQILEVHGVESAFGTVVVWRSGSFVYLTAGASLATTVRLTPGMVPDLVAMLECAADATPRG